MSKVETAFSQYGIKQSAIKIAEAEAFKKIGCVGSLEEEMEVIVIEKKCEGVVAKTRTRGSGKGELTLSLHMNYDLYVEAFGMVDAGLKTGIYAYGKDSVHKEFMFVAEVEDEDLKKKLICYPRCIMTNGISGSIENGAEEVAEIEITISVFADEKGKVKYEAMVSELEEDLTSTWLTNFTTELVEKREE